MASDGTLNIVEWVKNIIQSNNYSIHDCESHLERLSEMCDVVLSDYNKALDEKEHNDPRAISLERKTKTRSLRSQC